MSERQRGPKTVRQPIYGNPFKRNQITGYRDVIVNDEDSVPDTVIDQNGSQVRITSEPPKLHKPEDIGIPDWLINDIDD
jgi:hypothetical protein